MGVVKRTVDVTLLHKLRARNNYDYQLDDAILIINVNIPYDEIVHEYLANVSNDKRTAGLRTYVDNYFKGLVNNKSVFDNK